MRQRNKALITTLAFLCGLLLNAIAVSAQVNAEDEAWQKAVSPHDAQRAAMLRKIDAGAQNGRFRPDWESMKSYQIPEWYQDAKFGIFIHWGVYSVPAFGSEWYPRLMYVQGSPEFNHHVSTYGPLSVFGYKDFVARFRAEHFNARQWADLFREAGAKYVVPVAEHHDGFPMYGSDLTDWCAAKMGPKRDLIGELAAAVRADGLHFGASSHRAEHYFFLNPGRQFDSDVNDNNYAAFYGPAHIGVDPPEWQGHPDAKYLDDWLARTGEIVDKYHPELLYFDWWIGQKEFAPYLQRFAAYYYNQAHERRSSAVINYKNSAFPEGAAVLDIERGQLDHTRSLFWQTDTSVSNNSWGYIEHDTYKSPQTVIWQLVDIVSKNGTLLLNVGPKSDGTIPAEVQGVLREMGAWLRVNGEAIYATRPWTVYGEGPTKVVGGAFHDRETESYTAEDIRFTKKAETVYAIVMAWPANGKLLIRALGTTQSQMKAGNVKLLGSARPLKWQQTEQAVSVELPQKAPGKYAYGFRIEPAKK